MRKDIGERIAPDFVFKCHETMAKGLSGGPLPIYQIAGPETKKKKAGGFPAFLMFLGTLTATAAPTRSL
jgi:hypothetical protein